MAKVEDEEGRKSHLWTGEELIIACWLAFKAFCVPNVCCDDKVPCVLICFEQLNRK